MKKYKEITDLNEIICVGDEFRGKYQEVWVALHSGWAGHKFNNFAVGTSIKFRRPITKKRIG